MYLLKVFTTWLIVLWQLKTSNLKFKIVEIYKFFMSKKQLGNKMFWVDVLVYVELNGNIELFSRLESDIVVTQFPRYTSQNGLDKPV